MAVSSFVTAGGLSVPAVTGDQMREIDRIAVDETGPALFQMMENAGRSLALKVIEMIGPDWTSTPVLVLAGAGGNGGGGICAARHLANHGGSVTLVVADPDALGPVPYHQLVTYGETRGALVKPHELEGFESGLVVDAMIGYSLRGSPRGVIEDLIQRVSASTAPVVSLDMPSGIDATTGHAPGSHILATDTLTLALPKTGLDAPGVGRLMLADIGIPAGVFERVGIEVPECLFEDGYRVELTPQGPPPTGAALVV